MNSKHHKPSIAILFIAMLGFFVLINTTQAYAASTKARLYQVDIIIFQNKAVNYLPPQEPYALWKRSVFASDILLSTPETLESKNLAQEDLNLEIEEQDYLRSNTQAQSLLLNSLLPKEQFEKKFQLQTALKKIKASDQYQVLYAASWTSDFYYNKTKSFEILSNKTYLWPTGSDTHEPMTTTKRTEYVDIQPSLTPEFPELDGLLSFSLNRYFDIQVTLQILTPDYKKQKPIKLYGTSDLFSFTPLKVFHIKQHVRTRSKKLIYIDNPSYGILLYLTPIENKKTENKKITQQTKQIKQTNGAISDAS